MLRPSPRTASRLAAPWRPGGPYGARWASGEEGEGNGRPNAARAQGNRDRSQHGAGTRAAAAEKPSLLEQLFPEESKRHEEEQRAAARDIPRMPLDIPIVPSTPRIWNSSLGKDRNERGFPGKYRNQRGFPGGLDDEIGVLVMRNASLNLTDDDFRRLIPQGSHLEGWKVQKDDIIKVIPGRDMATLEQQNFYYLLFSGIPSAYRYQGHVTEMFRIVRTQTPQSVTSPIPPPPGYEIDGMDANAVIQKFALIPPSQRLELRELKPPLTPLVTSLVHHRGYAPLVKRLNKSPHECRLTFDGPQLLISNIRNLILKTGQAIGVTWSGGNDVLPKITPWQPPTGFLPSPMDRGPTAMRAVKRVEEAYSKTIEDADSSEGAQVQHEAMYTSTNRAPGTGKDRAPGTGKDYRLNNRLVYVLGFETAGAAQRFVAFWHRRPMALKTTLTVPEEEARDDERDELPAIANVEILW